MLLSFQIVMLRIPISGDISASYISIYSQTPL